jgi:hypothetical protein
MSLAEIARTDFSFSTTCSSVTSTALLSFQTSNCLPIALFWTAVQAPVSLAFESSYSGYSSGRDNRDMDSRCSSECTQRHHPLRRGHRTSLIPFPWPQERSLLSCLGDRTPLVLDQHFPTGEPAPPRGSSNRGTMETCCPRAQARSCSRRSSSAGRSWRLEGWPEDAAPSGAHARALHVADACPQLRVPDSGDAGCGRLCVDLDAKEVASARRIRRS